MVIVSQHEVFERRRGELAHGAAVLETLPSYTDGGIDADEEEERPSQQCINDLVVPYICRDPSLPPSQRDKV